MIRRILRTNDYIDIIRSCPSGVIDDIYSVRYFIQGHPDVEVEASFTRKGSLLEVILPTSQLVELGNGILMRRSLYRNEDPSFPDGHYDLDFVECLDVWLGEDEVDPPFEDEYVTEEELSGTLSSYATKEWVGDQGFLTSDTLPSDIATQSWVESQGYVNNSVLGYYATKGELSYYAQKGWVTDQISSSLSGYATESWVSSNFITIHQYESLNQYIGSVQNELYSLSEYVVSEFTAMGFDGVNPFATESYVSSYVESYIDNGGYAAEDPDNPFATEGWVEEQGYLSSDALSSTLSSYATKSWVESVIGSISSPEDCVQYDPEHPLIEDFGYNVDVLKRSTFDHYTGNNLMDRITKGLVLAYEEEYSDGSISGMNTIEIRDGYLATVQYEFNEISGEPDYHEHRYYYATESYVSSVLLGYATESWVESQGYLTSTGLSGLATQSWVEGQGYVSAYDLESCVMYTDEDIMGSLKRIDVNSSSFYILKGGIGNYYGVVVDTSGHLCEYNYDGFDETKLPFATQNWVSSQGYLTAATLPSDIATESYVSSALSGYATESWVGNQGYLTSVPSEYATQSWVLGRGYLTRVPSGYATQSWVSSQISDITSNTVRFDEVFPLPAISNYGSDFIVYKTSNGAGVYKTILASYSGSNIDMGIARYDTVGGNVQLAWFDPFATRSWISSQGYLSATALSSVLRDYVTWEDTTGFVSYNEAGFWGIDVSFSRFIEVTNESLFILRSDYQNGGLVGVKVDSSTGNLYRVQYSANGTELINARFATQTWVTGQGYLSASDLSDYATKSWVSNQGYLTAVPAGYATESWVSSQLSTYATLSYVISTQEIIYSRISSAMSSAVIYSSFMNYVAQPPGNYSCVDATTSGFYILGQPSWNYGGLYVSSNGSIYKFDQTSYWDSSTVYQELATQNWVSDQGYLSASDLSGYATESWVSSQLSDYASKSWVQNNYGTRNWTANNFLAQSKVWTGSQSAWNQLTSSEKAGYIIALITQ